MAYARGNPPTKKALRELVATHRPEVFSPGPFRPALTGEEFIEGPHYPAAHKWYARVQVKDGRIVKVLG